MWIDLPVFDCRLAAWKAWERARQSNKREVIGCVSDQNSIWCAALAKGCSKVNSTKILALKKNILWKSKRTWEQTWLELIIQNLYCGKAGDKWKALKMDNPVSLQEHKWQKEPMFIAAELFQTFIQKSLFLDSSLWQKWYLYMDKENSKRKRKRQFFCWEVLTLRGVQCSKTRFAG